jgi:hypothetical protein
VRLVAKGEQGLHLLGSGRVGGGSGEQPVGLGKDLLEQLGLLVERGPRLVVVHPGQRGRRPSLRVEQDLAPVAQRGGAVSEQGAGLLQVHGGAVGGEQHLLEVALVEHPLAPGDVDDRRADGLLADAAAGQHHGPAERNDEQQGDNRELRAQAEPSPRHGNCLSVMSPAPLHDVRRTVLVCIDRPRADLDRYAVTTGDLASNDLTSPAETGGQPIPDASWREASPP